MDLRELRSLVVLSEEAHFTRAAKRLHMAQSGLSQQIRKLEAELGVALVDRTTRRVRISEAGLVLVAHARRMLTEADDAVASMESFSRLARGRITIGVTPTLGCFDLADVLVRFRAGFPHIAFATREDLSVRLAEELRDDDLDVALLSVDGHQALGIETRRVAEEPLVCVVGRDHPLASRRAVSFRTLRDERLVMFRPGATIRTRLDDAFRDADITPVVAFETNDVSRTTSLIASGLAVGFLPASDALRAGGVVALGLRGTQPMHRVFLGWRRDRRLPPAAAAFVSLVLDGR